jgi:Excalibur calcium-binding domain
MVRTKMIRTSFAAAALIAGFGLIAVPATASAAPYKNCTEARKNGDTNIPSDSPNYGRWLDRDGDGIGCES